MNLTHRKGTICELLAQIKFVEKGCQIFTPIQPQSKTDFIALRDGQCIKVQVKSVTEITQGKFIYLHTNLKGKKEALYTKEDVDLFVFVYGDKLWFIPFEEVEGKQSVTIGKLVEGEVQDCTKKDAIKLSSFVELEI